MASALEAVCRSGGWKTLWRRRVAVLSEVFFLAPSTLDEVVCARVVVLRHRNTLEAAFCDSCRVLRCQGDEVNRRLLPAQRNKREENTYTHGIHIICYTVARKKNCLPSSSGQ